MQPWGQNVSVYRLSPEWFIGDVFLHKSRDKNNVGSFLRSVRSALLKKEEKQVRFRWGDSLKRLHKSFLPIGTSTCCVHDRLICMFNSHHPLVREHLSSNRKFTINITSVLDRWIIFSVQNLSEQLQWCWTAQLSFLYGQSESGFVPPQKNLTRT